MWGHMVIDSGTGSGTYRLWVLAQLGKLHPLNSPGLCENGVTIIYALHKSCLAEVSPEGPWVRGLLFGVELLEGGRACKRLEVIRHWGYTPEGEYRTLAAFPCLHIGHELRSFSLPWTPNLVCHLATGPKHQFIH